MGVSSHQEQGVILQPRQQCEPVSARMVEGQASTPAGSAKGQC